MDIQPQGVIINKSGTIIQAQNNTTVQTQKNKQKDKKENPEHNKLAPVGAGYLLTFIMSSLGENITIPIVSSKFEHLNNSSYLGISGEPVAPADKVKIVADNMVKTYNLGSKGFEYRIFNKFNMDDKITTAFDQADKPSIIQDTLSFITKFLSPYSIPPKKLTKQAIEMIKNGENAAFLTKSNIAVASEQLSSMILHEIGHARHYNLPIIGKPIMHGIRILPMITTPLIFLTSILHTKKQNDKQESNLNKAKNFIKEHCGSLAFLSFVPMILEEGLASKYAINIAKNTVDKNGKQILDSKQLGILKKSLVTAFSTYLLTGIIIASSIKAGSITKDKLSDT